MHLILDGRAESVELRPDTPACFQAVVPAGTWFGAESADPDGWALAGCTMAPGFDRADFEWGERRALRAAYPAAADVIDRLTASD